MTLSLKHTFASAKPDGVDTTLVQPSNWNAEHVLTLAAGKVVGRDSSGAGAFQELPLSFDPSGNVTLSAALAALNVPGLLNLTGTGAIQVPKGTTLQRPASPQDAYLRFNTDSLRFECYISGSWTSVFGGGTGSLSSRDTAPPGPLTNDLWFNTLDGQLYIYYNDGNSTQWVVITSAGSASISPGYARIATTANLQVGVITSYDTSGGAFVATLPAAGSLSDGHTAIVVNNGGSANGLTVSGNGSNISTNGLAPVASVVMTALANMTIFTWVAGLGRWNAISISSSTAVSDNEALGIMAFVGY